MTKTKPISPETLAWLRACQEMLNEQIRNGKREKHVMPTGTGGNDDISDINYLEELYNG